MNKGITLTSNGRVARLTALALATGTLVAAGASSAGAANTDTTTFTATGGGSVIRLTVNLPAALPLGDGGAMVSSLTQDLVLTGSNVRSGEVPAAVTTSVLGANGNVLAVSKLLEKSVTAEYGKVADASQNMLPDLSQLGITGKLLALESHAKNPNVDGTAAHSLSSIANLRIDGGTNLQVLLNALTSQLNTVLNTALGATGTTSPTAAPLAAITAPVQAVLGDVIATLNGISSNAAKPVTDEVQAKITELVNLLNNPTGVLSAKLEAAAADTSLLSVKLIESEQTISRHAGVMTSQADQTLTGISVLGGMVTIDGLSSKATAALGDGVSSALPEAIGNSDLLRVHAADLIDVVVNKDIQAILTSGTLPVAVTDAVQTAINTVTGLLNGVLGATLTAPTVSERITTADKASSSVSAARLLINPTLPGVGQLFDKPLLDVQFVPATAQVLKAQSAVPPVVVVKNSTPQTISERTLAATGAELPLTGAVAATLLGLAVIARRRRMAHLAE